MTTASKIDLKKVEFKKGEFKKPEWLRKKIVPNAQIEMENLLKDVGGLHTICQEAKCPNISECYANKNATFMILGNGLREALNVKEQQI